jgi:hypothetical protein
MARGRSLQSLWFLGLTTFFGVVASAVTLIMPDDRYLRFQQLTDTIQYRSRWIYERIHFDQTPIDVAVVGASRILYAVNAPLLEQQLSMRARSNVHVANLALPQAGFDLSTVLMREVIRYKHPKLVIGMAIEKFPLNGHPAFKDLADIGDIVNAPILVNVNYFSDLMHAEYRQIKLAIVAIDPPFFGYSREFDPSNYAGTEVDTTNDETLPDGHTIHHSAVHSRDFIEADAKSYAADLRAWRFDRRLMPYVFSISYKAYREMSRLALAGHAKFLLLFQSYYQGPTSPVEYDFLRRLATVILANWTADDYHLFMDSRHCNTAGATLITTKLADILGHDAVLQPVVPP